MQKNILIAVSGLTPQIITETLYCLAVKKKIQIDELYIITTSKGRDIIFGTDEEFNIKRKYPPLKREIKRLCDTYKIKFPKFDNNDNHIITAKEQSTDLYDIRNDKHNKLFPNKVCEFIKDKTRIKETILHCSISGGRKTMSVDLAFALSLFGKQEDKLYHVLIDEKLEFSKFFPENKKEDALLEIAEIPYVKLRPLIAEQTENKAFKSMSYTDIVNYMQRQLKIKSSDKLYISKKRNEIWFGENERVKMLPKELMMYTYFIERKNSGFPSLHINDIAKEFYNDSKEVDNVYTKISKINNHIRKAINDIDTESIFMIMGPAEFGTSQYGIIADTEKFELL